MPLTWFNQFQLVIEYLCFITFEKWIVDKCPFKLENINQVKLVMVWKSLPKPDT